MREIDNVPLDSVRINGGTQSRVELSQSTITEYAEVIRQAVELPPVVTFFDGVHFWLADGFHRYHAHREAGAMEIAATIRTGTQRDAVLYSVGANASHGLRRSNEDKRKAVETLLADPEWATWSNNAIAKACAVSDKTVATYRAEYLRNSEDSQDAPTVRMVERNGATYEQNTAKIGPSKLESGPTQASGSTATSPSVLPAAPPIERPTLVEQVLEQQGAASGAPAPDDDDGSTEAGDADPFDQLIEENKALERDKRALAAEVRALNERIAILTRDDLAAAADEWKLKFEQLSGRNRQLQETAREAQLGQKGAVDLLAKVRKALGVESNAEILPAISARRAA